MGLTQISGFFSYAHGDDVCNRLRSLKNDLIAEYRQITGDELELFFDHDKLEWGDRWEQNIASGIDSAAFFIPILSPLYFKSYYCQKELRQFMDKAEKDGAQELLLPIYYVDLANITSEIDEELLERVLRYQFEDWRGIRFAERCTERYRAAVGRLAERLAKAGADIEGRVSDSERDLSESDAIVVEMPEAPTETSSSEEVGNGKGFLLDSASRINDLSKDFIPHVNSFSKKMTKIGQIVAKHMGMIGDGGAPDPKNSIALFSKMAAELNPVTEQYLAEAKECASLISEIDAEIQVFFAQRRSLQQANIIPQDSDADKFEADIKSVVDTAEHTKDTLQGFTAQIGALKVISRVLYKPFRRIEMANTLMEGVLDTVSRWGSN